MKHYNDDSKKLIKNVVSLAVSALLLAAATFAWFNGVENATPATVSGSVVGRVQFDYMHISIPATKYLDGDDEALTVKTVNGNNATSSTIKSFVTSASGWLPSSGTAWNLASMYPGEFGVYKISYSSDGATRKLMWDTVTCADANAKKSICVYAIAQKKANASATPTDIVSTTTTLETLMNSVSQSGTIDVLTGISAERGYIVDVYYVIGMPATDFASVHNALRQTGATASITSVDVVESGS